MSNLDGTSINKVGASANPGIQTPPPLHQRTPLQTDLASTIPVSQRDPRFYFTLLIAGVATGFAANLFLGGAPGIGINLFLVVLVFFIGWISLSRLTEIPLWRKLCAAAALVYSLAIALRASEILLSVNLLLAIGFTALASTAAKGPMRTVWATIIDLLQVGFNAVLGALMIIFEAPWDKVKVERQEAGVALRVAIGILIAMPFLLIFGLLFARAEVQFGEIFEGFFTFITTTLFSNFWTTICGTFLALGLLRSAFLSVSVFGDKPSLVRPNSVLGTIESVTVLSLLNALFLVFVITQLPYLFGGQDRVTNTPDLAWSDYARRGFFELAWVAALLIPTLMLFMNFTSTSTPKQQKLIQALCGGLTLLAGIVIISALQRMLLYTHNFGLTELRVYVSTFIVMLALILVLLNVFNFTGNNLKFFPAALVIGFLFSIGIQTVNVQGLVAKDIISKHLAGKQADMNHLKELSTDALPAIIKSQLPRAEKSAVIETITARAMKGHQTRNWLYQPLSVVVN